MRHVPGGLRPALVFTIAVAVTLSAHAQETAQRRWSRPHPVSEVRLGPRYGENPSVAFNGQIYVVVWEGGASVVGIRLDANGELIDRTPFLVSDTGYSYSPKVVWNGERFLVAWLSLGSDNVFGRFLDAEIDLSPTFTILDEAGFGELHLASNGSTALVAREDRNTGALVSRDGSVRFVSFPQLQVSSIASNGTDYLVVTRDRQSPYSTQLTRVTGDSVETTAVLPALLGPQLVSSGSGYLLFSGNYSFTATPISSAGKVEGEPIVIASNLARYPDVTGVDENGSVTVLWLAASDPLYSGPLMMTRIANGVASSPIALGRTGSNPDSAGRLFVWIENYAVHHMLVDRPDSIAVTSLGALNQTRPRSTPTSQGWFAVWREDPYKGPLMATTIQPTLRRGGEIVVSSSDAFKNSAVVAASETVVLVAWQEYADSDDSIYGRRFTPSGVSLDASPVRIASGRYSADDSLAIIWTGRYFLVAFVDAEHRTIKSIRLTEDGVVIDVPARTIAMPQREGYYPQTHLNFAGSGNVFMLVWQDGEPPYECRITCTPWVPGQIEAVRFSREGEPIDPVQRILTQPGMVAWMPAVAAIGDRFLVASLSDRGVFGQIVLRDDFSLGRTILIAPPLPDSEDYSWERRLSATATEREFVVAWDDDSKAFIAFVSAEGASLSRLSVLADVPQPSYPPMPWPHVAARGDDLLLLYSDFIYEDGGAMRAFYRGYTATARTRSVKR